MLSCSQPDGPSGSAVGVDLGGQLRTAVLPVDTVQIVSYEQGASEYLYVGDAQGLNSEVLIRFFMPVVDTSFTVDSARIELNYGGGIGDGDIVSWQCQRIKHDMTGPPPAQGDIPTGTPLDLIVNETAPDSGNVKINLDPADIIQWLLPDSTKLDTVPKKPGDVIGPGDLIKPVMTIRLSAPDAMEKLIRIHSGASDSLRPRLHIYNPTTDSLGNTIADTLSVVPIARISLIVNSDPADGSRLIVGDGAMILTLLRFDVSELTDMLETSHVVINRAVVTLHRDKSLYPWGARKSAVSLRAQKLNDDKWLTDLNGWKATPAYSGYPFNTATVDSAEDAIEFVVTDPSLSWIETTEWDEETSRVVSVDKNFGVLIQPYSGLFHPFRKGIDIERLAFHAADDPDPALRPTLTVYYTEFIK